MDSSRDVQEFLTSRRGRITPQQAGLPLWGTTRRVPGLRRDEVAMLAGISLEYYTRLERGNLSGASEGVLDAVAGALRLDDAERAHPQAAAPSGCRSPRPDLRGDGVPSDPGLTMLVYTAEPGSATAEALSFLAGWGATLPQLGKADVAHDGDDA